MDSRCLTRSRRFTDTVDFHGKLLDQGIAGRYFLAERPVRQDHFMERVAEQGSTFIEIGALGDHLWLLDQLPHVTLRKSDIFGGVAAEHVIDLAR